MKPYEHVYDFSGDRSNLTEKMKQFADKWKLRYGWKKTSEGAAAASREDREEMKRVQRNFILAKISSLLRVFEGWGAYIPEGAPNEWEMVKTERGDMIEMRKRDVYGDSIRRKQELISHHKEKAKFMKQTGDPEDIRVAGKLEHLIQILGKKPGDGHTKGVKELVGDVSTSGAALEKAFYEFNEALFRLISNSYVQAQYPDVVCLFGDSERGLIAGNGSAPGLHQQIQNIKREVQKLAGIVSQIPDRSPGERNRNGATTTDMVRDVVKWGLENLTPYDVENLLDGFVKDAFALFGLPEPPPGVLKTAISS